MSIQAPHLAAIKQMMRGRLRNYIIPGLDSYLLGGEEHGVVRLFHSARDYAGPITPHSHRFDFTCVVLEGKVENRIWTQGAPGHGDEFQKSELLYLGTPGKYDHSVVKRDFYVSESVEYHSGEWYSMRSSQIHSIAFSADALVVFFEGPQTTDVSYYIEPVVDGRVIRTLVKEDWMFLEDGA